MPTTIEIQVFTFDELSDAAKERAREWWRAAENEHSSFAECVLEDAAECAKIIGIDLCQRPVKLMGGGTRYKPTIYYSGFYSQGDGACFEGTYSYAKGAAKAIRAHAPQDATLHGIADDLQELQRKAFYKLEALVKHRGHYQHEHSTDIEVFQDGNDASEAQTEGVQEALRDFMRWIYRRLESEYAWAMSDEHVDESIRANEYQFKADGSIA
jgi:hypothetical protein